MRKGQMKMTETIAVLFIFFILVVFGIVFYARYHKISSQEKQDQDLVQKAIDITTKVLVLPELECSQGQSEAQKYCLDLTKLRLIEEKGLFQQHLEEYYFNLFSYSTITVYQTYPLGDPDGWTIYNFPKPGGKNKEPTFFIVSLRDDFPKRSYNYGYIKVEVYS